MNKFLTLFLLFTFSFCYSQENSNNFKIGSLDDIKKNPVFVDVIGIINNEFYILRKGKSNFDYAVDKYSTDLKLLKSIPIEELAGRKEPKSYEFSMQDEDNIIYIYYSEYKDGINSLSRIQLSERGTRFIKKNNYL